MIELTRLKGDKFYLNCDKIEFIECTPDTVVSLSTGNKVVVRETPEQLLQAIKEYKTNLVAALPAVFTDME